MRLVCGPVELRLITPRSARQLFALARDPEVSRLLQWQAHRTVDDSLEFIADARTLWQRRRAFLPGIFLREDDQLVGCTGLSAVDHPNRRGEVGTWIAPAWQRTGVNVHAKAAMLAFAFDAINLERVEFLVRVDNQRSLRSMRRLPGIREEGVLAARLCRDGVAHDAVMFALLRADHDRHAHAWPTVEVDEGPPSA